MAIPVNFGKYYGEPVLWRCVGKETDGITLVSEYILCQKAFDAAERGTIELGSDPALINGSNVWFNSNIREWLNSSAQTVSFSTQAPTKMYIVDGRNAYADEPGFLSNFTQAERDSLKTIIHDGFSDKVFLLSVDEVRRYLGNCESQRMKKMTTVGKEKGEHKYEIEGDYWVYWLRSPYSGDSFHMKCIDPVGALDAGAMSGLGDVGVVPTLLISLYIPISGSGTEADPWKMLPSSGAE